MNNVLVLQHPQLSRHIASLKPLLPAIELPSLLFSDTVLRLPVSPVYSVTPALSAALNLIEADSGVLEDTAFADIGLIASDMDSTLITIECVDEIAAGAGLKADVAAITEQSMRGELDFEQSLRKRVSLLAGLSESVLADVYDHALRLSPGAQWLLDECKKHGVRFTLVSGGFTYFTDRLQKELGLDYAFSNRLAARDGLLTGELEGPIVDAAAKASLLNSIAEELHIPHNRTVAVGDGANDIPMLQAAGFGVAYHAKPKTEAAADIKICFGGLDTLRKWFR